MNTVARWRLLARIDDPRHLSEQEPEEGEEGDEKDKKKKKKGKVPPQFQNKGKTGEPKEEPEGEGEEPEKKGAPEGEKGKRTPSKSKITVPSREGTSGDKNKVGIPRSAGTSAGDKWGDEAEIRVRTAKLRGKYGANWDNKPSQESRTLMDKIEKLSGTPIDEKVYKKKSKKKGLTLKQKRQMAAKKKRKKLRAKKGKSRSLIPR